MTHELKKPETPGIDDLFELPDPQALAKMNEGNKKGGSKGKGAH